MSDSFWKTTLTPSDAPCMIEAGEVQICLKVEEGDWFAGILREEGDREPRLANSVNGFAGDPDWQRLGAVDDISKINVTPAYPDRALVVRPNVSYSVQPGERVQFFVGLPVWIRLQGPKKLTLLEVPAYALSNTWFGLPTEGELAYSLKTFARRDEAALTSDPLRVICPVRVSNQSKEALKFERICIRPRYLSIYEDRERGLWSNESSMIVRTDQDVSRVAYARKAPVSLKNPFRWQKGEEQNSGTHLLRAFSAGKGVFQ